MTRGNTNLPRLLPPPNPTRACRDQFACATAGTPVPDTLGTSSTDTVPCTAADVLDVSKRAFIRDTLIPAALDL